jgi:type IV fimbrial biogenesis protein FimT
MSFRASRGFTAIELMTVVAVIAVMATLAASSMSRFMAARQVEAAARRIGEDLAFGRNEAVKRNAPVLMCAAPSGDCAATPTAAAWAAGWRVCFDADADAACDAGVTNDPNPMRSQAAVITGIAFSGPLSRLVFNPNGTITAADFTEFSATSARFSDLRWTIRIAASGAVTVRKG